MLFAAVLAIAVLATILAGCTGTKYDMSTIYGKDLFDPAKFSLARYDVTIDTQGNVSHRNFIVTTARDDNGCDRLSSVQFAENEAVRTDAWIGFDRKRTLAALITNINETTILVSGGDPPFNLTLGDQSWNTLEMAYKLVDHANVTTVAGQYDGCAVYEADKSLYYGNAVQTVKVDYYLHPDSPVPVKYVVASPGTTYTYDLQSAYGPNDRDSTPERVIQSFFENLDGENYERAASYLVTYENGTRRYRSIDRDTYGEFVKGMNATYGDNNQQVLYVYTPDVTVDMPEDGRQSAVANWSSLHYQFEPLGAYYLDGHFELVKIGGKWKIIA